VDNTIAGMDMLTTPWCHGSHCL